jgi:hypothetical protein
MTNDKDLELEKQFEHLKRAYSELADRLRDRDAENELMFKCVSFYASEKNWYDPDDTYNPTCMVAISASDLTFNVYENGTIMKARYQHGGKLARETLKKLGEL